uniref:Protein-tyrosine-phosphatase n=1 Tax=Timema bartmani TaxID=61472 RepID=A0A7R9EYH6_9NEOP|nr:unnamed protein product [Timema bartmani]
MYPHIELKPPVAGSYNITLSWNVKEEGSNCPVDQYIIELSSSDQSTRQARLYRSDPTVLTGLRPFTNYSVVMKKYIDKKVVLLYQSNVFTQQAAPGLIKSLEVISTSTTSLNIQWDQPEQPNGIISHYNISYKHNGYLGCTVAAGVINDQSRGTFHVNATELHIQDLIPYSRYTIMVMGYTVAYGPSIMKSVETDQTELPEETPVLLSDSVKIYPFSIYLRWKPSQDCKEIKGIISQYKVIVDGISPWSEGTRKEYVPNTPRLDFNDAIPYTKYNISILAMRPSGKVNLNRMLNITLQTTEYTLEPVRDLTAYSMGPKWISLRWKEPYPPFGRVESYKIEYNKQRSGTRTIQIGSKSSPCDLWDNMICVTLESLEKDITYEIKVQAFNSNIGGQITAQSTRTVEKAPTAPLNLTVISTVENKTTMYWQYPDKTNGKLNKFKFRVTAVETWLLQSQGLNFNWEYNIMRETRNYTYTLEGFFPSTKYRVDVCGVTVECGDLTSVTVETRLSVPSFNETITVVEDSLMNMTAVIQLPAAHRYLTNSSAFFVMVGCQRCSLSTTKDTAKLKDESLYSELLNQIKFQQYVDVWIAAEIQPNPKGNRFIIGDNRTSKPGHFGSGYMNRPLKPDVSYYIVVVVLNQQGSDRVFQTLKLPSALTLAQEPETGNKGSNLGWIAVLLIVIVPVLLYLLYKKRDRFHPVHKPTLEMRMDSRKSIDGQLLKPPAPDPDPEPEPEMEDSPGSLQKSLSQRLSRRVNISELENYVRMALQSGELQRQHAVSSMPDDLKDDRTRVVLKKLPGDEFSDYINANYIAGYKADKFYIATQGPRPNTVVDFWRMIWQEQVSVVAMLANVIENGKKKCEQYWPELGKEETHGAVTILTADVSVFADFTFRHFNISCKSKKRKVSQLHFTSWPDHGVPFYPQSVAAYLKQLLLTPRGNGPILVHCSAGVGRTGTIILADICLRMAAAEGAVDILGFQQSMREERPNMVDNLSFDKTTTIPFVMCEQPRVKNSQGIQ